MFEATNQISFMVPTLKKPKPYRRGTTCDEGVEISILLLFLLLRPPILLMGPH